MYNVFNFDFDDCLAYLDNQGIKKYAMSVTYKPNGEEITNGKVRILPELQRFCLAKQHEYIRTALVCDCIDFVGLSKMINFDNMKTHKSLLVCLFTDYVPAKISHYKIKCKEVMNESIKNNYLSSLSKNEIIDLINFTNYRIQHLDLIDDINFLDTNPDHINKYKQFTNNIQYDYPYPFCEVE